MGEEEGIRCPTVLIRVFPAATFWYTIQERYSKCSLEERHLRYSVGGQHWDATGSYCVEDPSTGLRVSPGAKAEPFDAQIKQTNDGRGGGGGRGNCGNETLRNNAK